MSDSLYEPLDNEHLCRWYTAKWNLLSCAQLGAILLEREVGKFYMRISRVNKNELYTYKRSHKPGTNVGVVAVVFLGTMEKRKDDGTKAS